ncbi:hypothetical protein J21TS3_08280 [Paenibacillus cookii]|uniref:Uncharacterized protein n=1 Tax=Paenibacillus cookii TaxID=157839 RepID=A0ABQ4LRY1_9BACL|nr:hypothetical protein J21TS3_08280 [Paenibacillus cookii]
MHMMFFRKPPSAAAGNHIFPGKDTVDGRLFRGEATARLWDEGVCRKSLAY